jgi:uncharacterized protein (UPF0335 family)
MSMFKKKEDVKPVAKTPPTPLKKLTSVKAPVAKPATGSAKPVAKKAETYSTAKPATAKPAAPAAKAPEKKEADKVVGIGHNGAPTTVSKTVLKSVVDRIETLEEEKQGTSDDIKEIYTEAKSKGLDVKTVRKLVAARRRDKEKLRAEKELMDIYAMALDPELADVLS